VTFVTENDKVVLVFNYTPSNTCVLGSGCIAPRILNLGTRWMLVVDFNISSQYSPVGPTACLGAVERRQTSCTLPRIEKECLGRPTHSVVTSRLS
jgi:hypothetical protein